MPYRLTVAPDRMVSAKYSARDRGTVESLVALKVKVNSVRSPCRHYREDWCSLALEVSSTKSDRRATAVGVSTNRIGTVGLIAVGARLHAGASPKTSSCASC